MHNSLKILYVIGLIGLGLSCSDNPGVKVRYQAEKLFFIAEKAARRARIRPDLSDSNVNTLIRDQYGEVVSFCYVSIDSLSVSEYPEEIHQLSHIAFQATSRLAQLFYADQQYDTCIYILNNLLARIDLDPIPRADTYLNLGQALQSSGRWDSALVVFDYTISNFHPPVTPDGDIIIMLFNLPAHISDIYRIMGDSAEAAIRFDQAENYYKDLLDAYPNSVVTTAARTNLATLYERTNQWPAAIAQLELIVDSTGLLTTSAAIRMAGIYARPMNMPESALNIYDNLLGRLIEDDTLYQPTILFNISQTLIDMGKIDTARSILIDIKYAYSDFFDRTPSVQYTIAQAFELAGNWNRAETEYRFLIEKYAESDLALSTYLHLADYLREHGRNLEADRMEERAEAEYDYLARVRSGTVYEARALSWKAELYRRRHDWNGTIEILLDLFEKFPGTDIGDQALVTASIIHRDKLNNPATADSLLDVLRQALIIDE